LFFGLILQYKYSGIGFLKHIIFDKQIPEGQKYSEEQVDESEYIEIDVPPRPKQLEWANGNIYSYDFTETITKNDSLGIETFIIVCKNNPPNKFEIIFEKKVCK
jgi:hypothetical protein